MTMPDRPVRRPSSPFGPLVLSIAALILTAACGPARRAALEPPAVDIGLLEKDIVAKLAGQTEISTTKTRPAPI
jgi:hypothetical protein